MLLKEHLKKETFFVPEKNEKENKLNWTDKKLYEFALNWTVSF